MADDIILQMDSIGVGSLLIVVLTGTFSGAVMTLQLARALAQWGQKGRCRAFGGITGFLHQSTPARFPSATGRPTPVGGAGRP